MSFSKCRISGEDSRMGQDTKVVILRKQDRPPAPQGIFSHIVGPLQYVPCYSVSNKTLDISQHYKD